MSDYRLRWYVEVELDAPPGVAIGRAIGAPRDGASGATPEEALAALRASLERQKERCAEKLAEVLGGASS